jgi:hypothetical protein
MIFFYSNISIGSTSQLRSIDLIQDLYGWSRFLSWIAISSYTGRFWWFIFQVIFVVLIRLYTFFWSVYDFGPKHRKRSLFDILRNPILALTPSIQSLHSGSSDCTKETPYAKTNDSEHVSDYT